MSFRSQVDLLFRHENSPISKALTSLSARQILNDIYFDMVTLEKIIWFLFKVAKF